MSERARQALHDILDRYDDIAVAVSGGVDSMTLATVAGRHARARTTMFHAVSAAVPPDATQRVRDSARQEGWALQVIEPGELDRESYVANPVDRCLYCKRSLYDTIRQFTRGQIVSGANMDDLGDYRPGLQAAAEAAVQHPYVLAGIDKATVRRIATDMGLAAVADLPASPCLSSRVETGIRIVAPMLAQIDAVEKLLRAKTGARNVRCRVRSGGVVIELDQTTLERLTMDERAALARDVRAGFGQPAGTSLPRLEPYRMGSAFLKNAEVTG